MDGCAREMRDTKVLNQTATFPFSKTDTPYKNPTYGKRVCEICYKSLGIERFIRQFYRVPRNPSKFDVCDLSSYEIKDNIKDIFLLKYIKIVFLKIC